MKLWSMSRDMILDKAKQYVTKDRAKTHGDSERNFDQIAELWSARLGFIISSHQVAIMMIDLKTVRAWNNPRHADNWIDIAGYAACGGETTIEAEIDPL